MTISALPLITAMTLATTGNLAYAELKNIDIAGRVEVEAGFVNSDSNGNSSDIALATVELGIETTFSEQVTASILLLAEDIGTDEQSELDVDEAYLSMSLGSGMLTLGQAYLPFGKFETGIISDPLTLVLGETLETMIMYSRESESGLNYSVFVFNGDLDTANGDDKLNDFGFDINLQQEHWSVGLGYLSNLAESDVVNGLGDSLADEINGLNIYGSFENGSITILFEHVTALDNLLPGDLDNNINVAAEPSATHVEVGVDIGSERTVSLSYNRSDEAEELKFYETAVAIAYTSIVREQLGYAVELLSADEYNGNSDTILTVQLAQEF